MKKLLTLIILLITLTGCSTSNVCVDNNLGAVEKTETEKIHDFEKLYKEIEKKHKHIKKYQIETGEYVVNEYETPAGEVGYQIVKEDDDYLESVCIGIECDGKNFKTLKIKEDKTATSTKK